MTRAEESVSVIIIRLYDRIITCYFELVCPISCANIININNSNATFLYKAESWQYLDALDHYLSITIVMLDMVVITYQVSVRQVSDLINGLMWLKGNAYIAR